MRSGGVKFLHVVILLRWLAASLIDCLVGRQPARVQLTDQQASFVAQFSPSPVVFG